MHIKGPDEPGHDGNCLRKKEVIEAIDAHYFPALLAELDLKETVICVTSDLCTGCAKKAHSTIPVPLLVCGGAVKPDGSLSFSEKSCLHGSLGKLNGHEIMPFLVEAARK